MHESPTVTNNYARNDMVGTWNGLLGEDGMPASVAVYPGGSLLIAIFDLVDWLDSGIWTFVGSDRLYVGVDLPTLVNIRGTQNPTLPPLE